MKNKKGFTLIELLAVIVVLAIIMLVAVPTVMKYMTTAKLNAKKQSGVAYVKAINDYLQARQIYNQGADFTGCKESEECDINNVTSKLKLSGESPNSGSVTYQNNKVTKASLCYGDILVQYTNGETDVIKDGCNMIRITSLDEITEDGMYILDGNTSNGEVFISNNVTIDLNGYIVNEKISVGELNEDGKTVKTVGSLTITDSKKTGRVSETITVQKESSLILNSGSIGGTETTYNDGPGVINQGKFTMNGGSIKYNTANKGGGVYSSGDFEMRGGTISSNSATQGGGVYSSGDFEMRGGTISSNSANAGPSILASTVGSVIIEQGNNTSINIEGTVTVTGGVNLTSNVCFNLKSAATHTGTIEFKVACE